MTKDKVIFIDVVNDYSKVLPMLSKIHGKAAVFCGNQCDMLVV